MDFFSVACMQTLSGFIPGAFVPAADGARTETVYRTLFGVMSAVLLVTLMVYSRAGDIRPSDEVRAVRRASDRLPRDQAGHEHR